MRAEVVELARKAHPPHEQTPAYYDQLVGELVLKAGPKSGALPPAGDAEQSREAERAWAAVKDSTSIPELDVIVKRYERIGSVYADLARARIEELKQKKQRAEEERLGRAFRDCPDVCPEMLVIPAGSFMMGSPAKDWPKSENLQHSVTIAKAFAVGRFEVTFAEWDACVAAGGCRHRPGDEGWGRGRQPVIDVSWNDAKEYVTWLSSKTGKPYRMLTEAEWEYAARAGTTTPYSTGQTITTSDANFKGYLPIECAFPSAGLLGERVHRSRCEMPLYRGKAVEVGLFAANAFGLYDMHSNVWEWVEDCWHESYDGAPLDGSAWTTGECSARILRGGGWFGAPNNHSAFRGRDLPGLRDNSVGFRVARTFDR